MAEAGTKLCCARHPVQASARGQPSAALVGGEAEALPVLGAPEAWTLAPHFGLEGLLDQAGQQRECRMALGSL